MPSAKTDSPSRGSGVRKVGWKRGYICKMFYAYFLQSEKDGSHYYGHSKDLDNRLKKHNQGKVRYTKARRPWKLIYSETFDTKSEAYIRELFFKSIEGYQYLKKKGII
jgi:putative endonuclease